ncbi:MAG: TIGR02270 family protein, partial [Geobacter sp.]
FAEEAAFLWHRRIRAVTAPHFSFEDLVKLDERLEAHIDGLRVAGEAGWAACDKNLGSELPEEYFAPSVLAFESGKADRIQAILDAIGEDPAKARALISALGWIPYEQAEPRIRNLLTSESSFHRYIGIAASAIHRQDPDRHLDQALENNDLLLIARALLAYGELGGEIRLNNFSLRNNLSDDDDGIRFSTAWSAALTGNSNAIEVLKNFVVMKSAYGEKALNMALRRMEQAATLSWQKHLANVAETIRLAVIGAGIIGDPHLVPWLIEQMKTPALARVAGEAFTMITGVDIDQEELRGTWPEGFNAGPSDDPDDDNVAMDADLDLPWPNIESIRRWWDRNKGNFPDGTRYLLGKPVSVEHLQHVLTTGLQRQRAAAALELAIKQPGQPLFNVRAPGSRQREMLKQKEA